MGVSIVGIDLRPEDGILYGVGDDHRLYRIDRVSGAATVVGSPGGFTLTGSYFGLDFDPTTDRGIVVSDQDQRLLLHPSLGSGTPGSVLSYLPTDPASGFNSNVVALAYTSSWAGATSRQLYALDSDTNALVRVSSPYLTTVGQVGVDFGPRAAWIS